MLLKGMAVHCDTEEKAKAFIKECYNQGFISNCNSSNNFIIKFFTISTS